MWCEIKKEASVSNKVKGVCGIRAVARNVRCQTVIDNVSGNGSWTLECGLRAAEGRDCVSGVPSPANPLHCNPIAIQP